MVVLRVGHMYCALQVTFGDRLLGCMNDMLDVCMNTHRCSSTTRTMAMLCTWMWANSICLWRMSFLGVYSLWLSLFGLSY